MINFIDEKGVKHSAIVECKKTKGVNGEKSLSGTIYTNDEILEGIGRGWRLEFENEKYCLTYVYPIDEGNRIVVEFDAVHEFFFDLNKKVVYSELNGSNTAKAYLDLIFNGSGYSYLIEVNIPAFEKEGFGMRNRLDLFKEFVSDTGVEFSVNGKVVRILEKVGSNLSTIVKKGFNLNELRIEKDPGSFITYKKGFGAWRDDDDHSKGRLEVEYLSPLASVYGKLEGDPIVDERYKVASNFETRLKNDVELSYGISVDIDMEDLTKAGYEYEQPHEGDYIMAINKDLGFEQKIRIMSYETSYDTNGNIVDHKVSCGSDNIIRKSIKEDDDFRKEIQAGLEGAISTSNKAWVSANGKNAVFEGPDEPTATAIGDTWFQIDGDKKIMRIWNGYEWKPVFNPGEIENKIDQAEKDIITTTELAQSGVDKANQAILDAGFANSSITAANGQIASLEQNLNGFQQVVQNTYADKTTVTALANQWTQTTELANGHTSQIASLGTDINLRATKTEVAGSLGAVNLITNGGNIQSTAGWSGTVEISKHPYYKSNTANLLTLITAGTSEVTASGEYFNIEPNTEYTLTFYGFASSNVRSMDVHFLSRKNTSSNGYDNAKLLLSTNLSSGQLDRRSVTFTTNATDNQAYIRFDNNGSTNGAWSGLYIGDITLVKGSVAPSAWFESTADSIMSQINISPESILIASAKIQIKGDTYIESGVIKTAHIADLAVSGAKIANASIASAKIISLDASKISVGTLTGHTINGAVINGGSITGTTFHNEGADGNVTIANGRIRAKDFFVRENGALVSETGYIVVRSMLSDVFLQSNNEVRVTSVRSYNEFMPIRASTFTAMSHFYSYGAYQGSNNTYYQSNNGWVSVRALSGDIYLQGGAVLVVDGGAGNSYKNIYANAFIGRGGNTAFGTDTGYSVLRSSGDTQPVYLQGNEIRATKVSTAGTYVAVRASAFPTGSMEEFKTDIKRYTNSALRIIRESTIYDYKLKSELESGRVKTRIGLVIGHGYNTPNEIIDGDGVEQYAMNALGWKAIQELDVVVQNANHRINTTDSNVIKLVANSSAYGLRLNNLESEVFRLKKRIEELEKIA